MEASKQKKGVRLTTSSVSKTIERFCQEKNIALQKIDFDFLGVKTEVFSNTEDEKPKVISLPIDPTVWLDNKISIRQTYEIFLHFANPQESMALSLRFGGNKNLTSVVAFIKPTSKLSITDDMEAKLEAEMNKRKLKMGLLIGVYDEVMKRDIATFCSQVRKDGKITKEYKIELFHGPDFVPSRDDSLELVFQKHSTEDAKSSVFATKTGSDLVVYQKARMGRLSRDAKGRLLEPSEPKTTKQIDFKVGDGIQVIDSENKTIFRAKKTGFVIFGNGEIDVKEEMALQEVSLRTGSIDAGMDSDSKLDITDDNPDSEAIGDNMSVRAAVVNVQGSVGANATIVAKEVFIGGQTHKTSKITATKAHLKNHKGYIEADEVEIDTLEGGEVVAKKVTIGVAIGAKIKADECHIKTLGSNNVVNATRLIEIATPQGGENKLSIEAAANASDMKALNELEAKISSLQKSVEERGEFVGREKEAAIAQSKTVKEIKAKIEEERKKNSPLANVLLAKLKHFGKKVDNLKKEEAKLIEEKQELEVLLEEADLLQYKVLDAKVLALSPWQGYNEVSFKLIFPPREFNYKVMEGSGIKEIILRKISDVDYEVFAL